MQIQHTKELDGFFKRCRSNMANDTLNAYLGKHVTSGNEAYMKKKLFQNGAMEFDPKNKEVPSLFIQANTWKNTPYHKEISLEKIQTEHFTYSVEPILGNELFNLDTIQKDPNKELRDWMKLRAFDQDTTAIYLLQDDMEWMLDAPSEAVTNDPYAKKAHGKVVTFGLGIGYFLYMASRNPSVTSITVIERSDDVIALFKEHILPQFPSEIEINIIQGDAFDCFNQDFLQNFDYCYVDIWQSSNDGLFLIEGLLENYEPSFNDCDFWIEDSCFQVIWSLIYVHFDELYYSRNNPVFEEYGTIMQKIRMYFASLDLTVTSMDQLKFYMYDNETIRHILAQHI